MKNEKINVVVEKQPSKVLYVLLKGAIAMAVVASLVSVAYKFRLGDNFKGENPVVPWMVFGVLVAMYVLAKKGYEKYVSYVFFIIFLLAANLVAWKSGIENPITLLLFAFLVTLTGVLVDLKFLTFFLVFLFLDIIAIAYLEINSWISPNFYWKNINLDYENGIAYYIMLGIIGVVSYLYNREIHDSLNRALKSEQELKKERDLLEVRVEQRTNELKKAQLEQIAQFSKFAEYGKSVSGLIHDLVNPITAISLNLNYLKNVKFKNTELADASGYAKRATQAVKKLENYVSSFKKQLHQQKTFVRFSVTKELKEVMIFFDFKIKRSGIDLCIESRGNRIFLYGDPAKFDQALSNIIANAIDALSECEQKTDKKIIIEIKKEMDGVKIKISDNGCGISKENIVQIFDVMFSTKGEKGLGIGMAITKNIIENDFGGDICVESEKGVGTVFTIFIPNNK